VYRVAAPIVTFSWTIPRSALSARWIVQASCARTVNALNRARKASTMLTVVHGSQRGKRVLIRGRSVRIRSANRGGFKPLESSSIPSGGKGGGVDCSPGVLDASSYCTGYCTWWVYHLRPEAALRGLGDAWEWWRRAPGHGLHEGHVPVAGAVAWWGADVGGGFGHVAYVVSATSSTVTISEMNALRGWGKSDEQTITLGSARAPEGYIYGGPAGAESGSGGGGGGTEPSKAPPPPGGFDGHGLSQIAVYRRSDQTWHIRGFGDFQYGAPGDIPVPGNYDPSNPSLTDIAVYRPADGTWHIRGVGDFQYGAPGDIPVPAAYDSSKPGVTQIAVYRPADGIWHVRGYGDFPTYGQKGDIPVPGHYDPSVPTVTDIAVYRPSDGTWHVRGYGDFHYGEPGDTPVPGAYNPAQPGTTEMAVYRPSDGTWHIRTLGDYEYGQPGDIPVPGNFNAETPSTTEIAVYRPSNGTWHIRTVGDYEYGAPEDIPITDPLNAEQLFTYGFISGF
jgi:surface antigen